MPHAYFSMKLFSFSPSLSLCLARARGLFSIDSFVCHTRMNSLSLSLIYIYICIVMRMWLRASTCQNNASKKQWKNVLQKQQTNNDRLRNCWLLLQRVNICPAHVLSPFISAVIHFLFHFVLSCVHTMFSTRRKLFIIKIFLLFSSVFLFFFFILFCSISLTL